MPGQHWTIDRIVRLVANAAVTLFIAVTAFFARDAWAWRQAKDAKDAQQDVQDAIMVQQIREIAAFNAQAAATMKELQAQDMELLDRNGDVREGLARIAGRR